MTQLAFALHIAGGTIGLVAGTVAVLATKGAHWHRVAGKVFFASMLVMGAFADYLAVMIPNQIPNFVIGTFTIYLVATAWMTVRRQEGTTGFAEKIALAVSLCLCLPFGLLSIELLSALKPSFNSAMPLEGPVRIALYTFTVLIALAAIGDARMVWAGGIAGARRIVRHLWRMCLGLSMAAGSAFTNGLPRLLPHGVRVPLLLLFLPQLAVLALLIFWALRVRFTGWYSRMVPQTT
jgi:uncharacterized membrane protein